MTTKTQDTKVPDALVAEPCANCGTPLAADQRYCLNCGDRRAGVRLDFLDILSLDAAERASANAAPAVVAAQAVDRGGAEGWVRKHAGVLALSGAVLLALFGGVAIGNWIDGDSGTTTPAKPQVIKVDGASGSSSTDDSASSDSSDSSEGDASDSGSSADSSAEKGGSGDTSGVQSADQKSSKDIEKSVDKGEPLSTGDGAAAKDDGKPAGGGSDFDTIE